MSNVPRLSIGLPVYNGEQYLAASLDALLAQTFDDFELVVSDNASADGTEEICRDYAERDPRLRYVRQPSNIGMAGNHNVVFALSRGELFKWASHDDLYAPTLLERCVEALDEHPDAVLSHSYVAMIEGSEPALARAIEYPLTSSSDSPSERFRSLLFDNGGDDDYGIMRADMLRRVHPYDSYYRADRTIMADVALQGRFVQVPEWLYFRRDHPGRSSNERSVRAQCAIYDAKRADRLRHPILRLYAEYVWAYVSMIRRAPVSAVERRRCFKHLAAWGTNRMAPWTAPWTDREHRPPEVERALIRVSDVLPGYHPSTESL